MAFHQERFRAEDRSHDPNIDDQYDAGSPRRDPRGRWPRCAARFPDHGRHQGWPAHTDIAGMDTSGRRHSCRLPGCTFPPAESDYIRGDADGRAQAHGANQDEKAVEPGLVAWAPVRLSSDSPDQIGGRTAW